MSNSYVMVLKGLYEAIFEDVLMYFPSDHKDLGRDKSRLLFLLDNRGPSFLTIDLPAAGKHFDASLSAGFLTKFMIPGFGNYLPGTKVPKFLSALMLRVFEKSGMLLEQPDITAIFLLRQLFYAAKKVRITCDESRTTKAVREFFRIERVMVSPSLDWLDDAFGGVQRVHSLHLGDKAQRCSTDAFGQSSASDQLFKPEQPADAPDTALLDTIQRTADIVSSSFGDFTATDWRMKHGPGAVADVKGGVSKYTFPNWPAKLETVFPMSEFAFANSGVWADAVRHGSDAIKGFSPNEPPSKLIAVPKTQKGPRLIASEPVAHQWVQQSLMNFLRDGVSKTPLSTSIHFRDQTENQKFALQASKTGTHWTIDLSSASDCLSLWVVERFFRRNKPLLKALHASRTRWLTNTVCQKSPQYVILKKFAPQGAATTFPVQTVIYATIALGAIAHRMGGISNMKSLSNWVDQVRVFGDDIIVPDYVGEDVVKVLTYLGFEVNQSKTYKTGRFRESCGCDAYDGIEVSPAYFLEAYDESQPASVSSVVECSNNFHRKGLWHTAAWLKSTLPSWIERLIPVVSTESGALGWTSYTGTDCNSLSSRYNPQLQREEFRTLSIQAKVNRRDRKSVV